MLRKIVRRLKDLLTIPTYRRVLVARALDKLLRLYNPNIRYIGLETSDGLVLFRTGETVVTPYALAENGFQKQDVLDTFTLARKQNSNLGGAFFDVGANIGTSTIYALKTGLVTKAYCFEPVPDNIELLQRNLQLNGLEDSTKVIPEAVTDKPTSMRMQLSKSNAGDNRVISNAQSASNQDGPMLEVRCTSLDTFMDLHQIAARDVSLVWVDTQGHEGFVLAGAQKLMAEHVPFCLEFWPQALHDADNFTLFCDLLAKHYTCFYDLREATKIKRPTSEIRDHGGRYSGDQYTDLVVF